MKNKLQALVLLFANMFIMLPALAMDTPDYDEFYYLSMNKAWKKIGLEDKNFRELLHGAEGEELLKRLRLSFDTISEEDCVNFIGYFDYFYRSSLPYSPKLADYSLKLQFALLEKYRSSWPIAPLAGPQKLATIYYAAANQAKGTFAPLVFNLPSFPFASGEDSSAVGENENKIFAIVADGVGGSNITGYSSGLLSFMLTENVKNIAINSGNKSIKNIIKEALDNLISIKKSKEKIIYNGLEYISDAIVGTTTAAALSIDKNTAQCRIFNYGDSGTILFRDGSVIYHTQPGEHGWNSPFEIGIQIDGDKIYEETRGQESEMYLQPGDFLILATDGLLDAIWPFEIAQLIKQTEALAESSKAENLNKELADLLLDKRAKNNLITPWSFLISKMLNNPDQADFNKQLERFKGYTEPNLRKGFMETASKIKPDDFSLIVIYVAN